MRDRRTVDILGLPVDVINLDSTVEVIEHAVTNGESLFVASGNVDMVMKARRDPAFAEDIRRADLVIADGVPLIWAASLLGDPLPGRVNGTDLVWRCAELSGRTGSPVALVGSEPGVTDRAVSQMTARHPGAKIRAIPTPMPLTPEDSVRIADTIREMDARIVLVALGAPRQERWILEYLKSSGANVAIAVGSAFDIICGDKPRAPGWMQRHGLEWLHRMLQEPRRLGKRYIIEDSPFFVHLLRTWVARRFGKGDRRR